MQTILALVLVVVLGYTGAHLLFYQAKFPLGTRYVLFAGSEYLFLGLVLGTSWLAILTPQITQLLSPLVNLSLGWIGFLFGLQFEWKQLRSAPLGFMGVTLLQAIITFFTVWSGLRATVSFFNLQVTETAILLLASIACISSPTCLAFLRIQFQFPRHRQRLSQYISSLDSIVGLTVFGLIYSGTRYSGSSTILLYLCSISCLIIIFHLLTRFYVARRELLILTVGLVIFSSGIAGAFGLSALLLNFLLGVGLINLPSSNHRTLSEILHKQEKPIYILFMVLAGAMWVPSANQFLIISVYLCLRLLGKLLGAQLAGSVFKLKFKLPVFWGLSIFPQGGMGIAMAVDYLQYHPGTTGADILNIILITTLITQLSGPLAVRHSLIKRA